MRYDHGCVYICFFVPRAITMSKAFHLWLMLCLIPISIPIFGCGGDDQPQLVEEERPGQFRQMAEDAADGEDDVTER
jgi:hypothetical protein